MDLAKNVLKSLPVNVFQDLVECHILDLSANRIEVVGSQMFTGMCKLENLQLHDNDISVIEIDALQPANCNSYNLKTITLFGNRLITVDEKWFEKLQKYPVPLFLGLSKPNSTNQVLYQCGTMCWIKLEETAGNITFFDPTHYRYVDSTEPCGQLCSNLKDEYRFPAPIPLGPISGSFQPACANGTWKTLLCPGISE